MFACACLRSSKNNNSTNNFFKLRRQRSTHSFAENRFKATHSLTHQPTYCSMPFVFWCTENKINNKQSGQQRTISRIVSWTGARAYTLPACLRLCVIVVADGVILEANRKVKNLPDNLCHIAVSAGKNLHSLWARVCVCVFRESPDKTICGV